MRNLVRLRDYRNRPQPVFFDRHELHQLLTLYSRRVISGEWRDYAIDHDSGMAIFSIFRHAADRPAYTVIKSAPDAKGNSRYVLSAGPRRLKKGGSIEEVLAVLDRRPRIVFSA